MEPLVWGPALTVRVVEADPPIRSIPAPSPHGMKFVEPRSLPTVRVESIGGYLRRAGTLQSHRRLILIDGAAVRFAIPSDRETQGRLLAGLRKWPCALTAKPPDTCVRLRTVCLDTPRHMMKRGDPRYYH